LNVIDRAIGVINPQAALKREGARLMLENIQRFSNSGYSHSGASRVKKSMVGWVHESLSPVEDIDYNLNVLRQRSRDLYTSAPLAVSAIKSNRTNVVGSGLHLKSAVDFVTLGITEQQARDYEFRIEKEFNLWASSKFCDALRLNNFYELQQLSMMSWLLNGDSFALPKYNQPAAFMPYGLNILLIEGDRISTPGVTDQNGRSVVGKNHENGNRIYYGVEIDDVGAVVAYHICNTYPNTRQAVRKEWTRVEAFGTATGNPNVIQLMESERCEQYRGIPYLAPVIETLKQVTRYTEAELTAAIVNSFFTAFIKTDGSRGEIPLGESVGPSQQVTTEDDQPTYELGPGTINTLGEGEDVVFSNPTRPASGFDPFISAMAKQIGAAVEVPYELLMKSFGQSYSASRAALLEAWKAFRMRRVWLAEDFCQPVYELFLSEAVGRGRLTLPGFFVDPLIRKAWCSANWNGPACGQLDPVKEVQASIMKVNNGFSTHERETMELNGGDFNQNAVQLKREREALGIEANQNGGTGNAQ
jgi:lambda family phage portal protein